MTLQGRVALVTGAGHGIGRGIALRLAREGAAVAIADIDESSAVSVAEEVRALGRRALPVRIDVRQEAAVTAAVAQARAELGPLGILVNNAGVFRGTPLLTSPLADWDLCISVNLTGPWLCARAATPDMIEQRWGRIVNVSSWVSKSGFGQDAAYVASKTGVLGLTRSLAHELAPNICVNTICPGDTMTQMLEVVDAYVTVRDGKQRGQFLAEAPNRVPLRRLGTPDDIAGVVAFLCGPDGGYITGQSIHVDGGIFMI